MSISRSQQRIEGFKMCCSQLGSGFFAESTGFRSENLLESVESDWVGMVGNVLRRKYSRLRDLQPLIINLTSLRAISRIHEARSHPSLHRQPNEYTRRPEDVSQQFFATSVILSFSPPRLPRLSFLRCTTTKRQHPASHDHHGSH